MERKGLNPSSGSKMCALLQKHLWPVGYILIDNIQPIFSKNSKKKFLKTFSLEIIFCLQKI